MEGPPPSAISPSRSATASQRCWRMNRRSSAQAISSLAGSRPRSSTSASVASAGRPRRWSSSAFRRSNRARSLPPAAGRRDRSSPLSTSRRARSSPPSASRRSTRPKAARSTSSSASSLRAMNSSTPAAGAEAGSSMAASSSRRTPCVSSSGRGFRRSARNRPTSAAVGSLHSSRACLSHPTSESARDSSSAMRARRIRRRHSRSGSSPPLSAEGCPKAGKGATGARSAASRQPGSVTCAARLLRRSPQRSPSAPGSPRGWPARWRS